MKQKLKKLGEFLTSSWFYVKNFRTIRKKLEEDKKNEKQWENQSKRLSQSGIFDFHDDKEENW